MLYSDFVVSLFDRCSNILFVILRYFWIKLRVNDLHDKLRVRSLPTEIQGDFRDQATNHNKGAMETVGATHVSKSLLVC